MKKAINTSKNSKKKKGKTSATTSVSTTNKYAIDRKALMKSTIK